MQSFSPPSSASSVSSSSKNSIEDNQLFTKEYPLEQIQKLEKYLISRLFSKQIIEQMKQ